MRWLFWWRPPALLRTVIVNFITEETAIKGVLWSSRGPWLTLRNASLLKAQSPPTPIDGEVFIHRSQIQFMQALPVS